MNDLKTKIKALEKALHALKPFVNHAPSCDILRAEPCSCGLQKILKKAEKALGIKV